MAKKDFSFNFWPSFTDLMLSFVLIVLIILAVVSTIIAAGSENLDRVKESQQKIAKEISDNINGKYRVKIIPANDIDSNSFNGADIYIIDKLDRQTITFSDKVLFDSGKANLKPAGYQILNIVGPIIGKNLNNIVEIQIQGHADIDYKDDFNLALASNRAIAVYQFLQNNVGIDPAKYLMSATSFGKYKPVGREPGMYFDYKKLQQANENDADKARNRRIEIVLYFNNQKQ